MNKTNEELIKLSLSEIMGWKKSIYQTPGTAPIYDDNDGNEVYHGNWNPLTNANQLEMLEEELVKLGFSIVENKVDGADGYLIEMDILCKGKYVSTELTCDYGRYQIRITRLKAYCEAYEKYLELKK